MAKRPTKISDILAKKNISSPIEQKIDFISETKSLVEQFQSTADHMNNTSSIDSTQIQHDLSQSTDSSKIGSESDGVLESHLNALIVPLLKDNSPPTCDTKKSEVDERHNHTTNIQHTYNKPTSTPTTVVQQSYNNHTTNIQHTYNKPTSTPTTVVHKKPTTIVQHNLQQSTNKHTTKIFASGISRLSGHGLTVLEILFKKCVANGSRQTGPLSIETIASLASGPSTRTMQTVIYRLEKDGYILRAEFKAGRGGWTSYEIPNDIYNQMIQFSSKLTTNVQHNLQHTYNKPTSIPTSEPTTLHPSKLVSNINTNYTELENEHLNESSTNELKNSWFKNLDFSKLPMIKPLMINSAIRKEVEATLDPDDVQIFINKFKNWISMQQNIKNPVAIFCEKIKEYCKEGGCDVLYALSDDELEAEMVLAAATEEVRQKMALIAKSRELAKAKELDTKFEQWYLNASDEELNLLLQPTSFMEFRSEIYLKTLKGIFAEKMDSNIQL